jgi:hypothetical protein
MDEFAALGKEIAFIIPYNKSPPTYLILTVSGLPILARVRLLSS